MVDAIRPRMNPAGYTPCFDKSNTFHDLQRLLSTPTHSAVGDDFLVSIHFIGPLG